MRNKSENRMGTERMTPLIFNMTWPPFCSMMMAYSYNFVDSMFVSWISSDALEAVSLAFPLNTFIVACAIGFGVGINVLVARHLGAGNQREADRVATNGIWAAALIGLILNILIVLLLPLYFSIFTNDSELMSLCMDYTKIFAFMVVATMLQIAIQKILQGTGNMIAPMLLQMLGVIFNFILDPALIFGWGPLPEMGIKGAAVATVFGYTLSAAVSFYVLMGRKQRVKVRLLKYGFSPTVTLQTMRIGLPSFFMNALGALMVSFCNGILIAFSTSAVAFFGAYFKLQQIIERGVNSLVQGVLPIMSYNYGAKKYDRLKEALYKGNLFAVAIMSIGALFVFMFPTQILAIFKADASMLQIGVSGMRIMVTGYIFAGLSIIFASYMQATGDIRQSIIINLLRQAIILFPAMLLLSNLIGILGVWLAFPVSEILTCLYSVFVYIRRKKGYKTT